MLEKLRDPRIIASAIAISSMVLDDLPEPQYNTFHDPGAAAMLSIILANAVTLAGRPRWNWATWVALGSGLVVKYFLQGLFWIENAWLWDTATLVLTHSALGLVALKGPIDRRFVTAGAASGAVICALLVARLIGLSGASWIVLWLQLAAARVLIPFAFWTAVLFTEARPARAVAERRPT
jgi:hypothetical protein